MIVGSRRHESWLASDVAAIFKVLDTAPHLDVRDNGPDLL